MDIEVENYKKFIYENIKKEIDKLVYTCTKGFFVSKKTQMKRFVKAYLDYRFDNMATEDKIIAHLKSGDLPENIKIRDIVKFMEINKSILDEEYLRLEKIFKDKFGQNISGCLAEETMRRFIRR